MYSVALNLDTELVGRIDRLAQLEDRRRAPMIRVLLRRAVAQAERAVESREPEAVAHVEQ